MKQLHLIAALGAFLVLTGASDAQSARRAAAKPTSTAMCEDLSALAVGFGRENVTGFAEGNLDLVINDAKNRLADKGAKGFKVGKRTVACGEYIDFGGGVKEHKCTARARLCGSL